MRTILETERLILREYDLSDLPNLHAIQSDPITMSHWQSSFTLENSQSWMERAIASYANNGFGRYAVIPRSSGEQIGDFGIMRVMVNGVEENDLGYILHYPYWHNGLATEAAQELLHFGFQTIGMDRVVANMAHDNVPSRRVAETIGMKREAEFFNPRNRGILTYLYSISVSGMADMEKDA
jgi:RimJ/RimL family protein N-acetyltransferase